MPQANYIFNLTDYFMPLLKNSGIEQMFTAVAKALGQIGERRLRKVLLKSIVGAFGVFILTWMVLTSLLSSVVWSELPYIGALIDWMGFYFDAASVFFLGAGIVALTYILFPPVMTSVMGFFLDEVCEAVEDKHYPNLGPARDSGTTEAIVTGLKFLGIIILVNLIAMPFYALTWWFGLGFVLYYLINGYLLGREYFEQVAHRRMDPRGALLLRKTHSGKVMFFGCVVAFSMTIPFVNLVIPVLATTTMVHMFMGMRAKSGDFAEHTGQTIITG